MPDDPDHRDSRVPAQPQWTGRGTPAYRRISLALFLAGFSTFSLLYCVQPLLPVFAETFGVSAAVSSLALSVSTGLLAPSILLAGGLSVSISRKNMMFASLCAASLLNLAAAFAPSWHVLLLLRALEGIMLGGVPAIAMAYLAEEIHPDGLGFTMGLYVGGTAFGGMLGRVITGFVAEETSWHVALATVGALGLAAAIAFVLLLPHSRNFAPGQGLDIRRQFSAWRAHLRHGGLPWLFMISFLMMGSFVTVYNYTGFRLLAPPYGLSQAQIGLIFTSYMLGTLASSGAGALADRVGRGPVLIAGILITIAGVGLTLPPSLGLIITGIACLTFGFFAAHSVASGWVGRMAAGDKAHAASLYLLAYYLGSSLMGSLGGSFWSAGGWSSVANFVLIMLALSLTVAIYVTLKSRALNKG
jgi:YNFM family putative membrane transporter